MSLKYQKHYKIVFLIIFLKNFSLTNLKIFKIVKVILMFLKYQKHAKKLRNQSKNEDKNEDKNETKKLTDKKTEDIYFKILKNKTNKNFDIKYIFMKVKGKISNALVKLPVIKYII
jgi:hypothetical protein